MPYKDESRQKKDLLQNIADETGKHYASIYDNLNIAIFRISPNGKVMIANQALLRMLGFASIKELSEVGDLNIFDELARTKTSLIEKNESLEYETECEIKNGLKNFVRVGARAIRDEKGEILYIDGTIENISKTNIHKSIERRTYEKYEDLMQNDLTADFISDAEGKLLICNNAYIKMLGYDSKEDAMSRNFVEIHISKVHREAFLDIIKKNKSLENYEIELVKVNGQHIYVSGNFIGEFDKNGILTGIIGYLFNITKRKQAEKELSELSKLYTILSEINQTAVNIPDIGELFNKVVKIVKDEGGYKAASIFIYNNENNTYDLQASAGLNQKYLEEAQHCIQKYNDSYNYISQQISKYEFLIIDDIKVNYQLKHLTELEDYNGFSSILFLPLKLSGKIAGLFQLYSETERGFNSGEVNFFNELAAFISFAYENYHREKLCSQTEFKLTESERKYSILFNNVQDVFYQVNLEGIILDISPSIKYFAEFERTALIGKPVTNLYYNPEDRDNFLKKIYEKGEVRDYEIKFKTSSGKIKYASINARLIYNSEGNPDHMDGAIRDITKRVIAELELRKLKQAVEQSQISVVITDIDGNIEYVNSHFLKQTGYSFEEVKGNNPRILKSNEQDREFYKNLWDTISSGNNWFGEILNRKKNNELYWANCVIAPISNTGKDITHYVAIEEDITEKKKMIDELILAKERAEEINRIKSYFFANMSHEIRTPFVGILGNAEYLTEKLTKKADRELAEGILVSSKRLMDTLNKILEITEIESKQVKIRLREVQINKFLDEIKNLFEKTAEQKNLFLKVEQKNNIPFIYTDENLLYEILANLVSNAVKYSSQGVISIISDYFKEEDRDYLTISVKDEGIGIPEDKQELIWQEFRQVSEGYNRKFEGAGLGLTIVKKYVQLLNGRISVESKLNKGSNFTVYIPYNTNLLHSEKVNEIKEEKKIPDNSKNKKSELTKILYVEDDPNARFVVKKFIDHMCHLDFAENSAPSTCQTHSEETDSLKPD